VIGAFLEDCCNVSNGDNMVSTTELFKAYQNWCAQNNLPALSKIVFGKKMRERGFEAHRTKKARFLRGIILKPAERV
jgi:phage/plasmid-associated DNA primase